MKVLKKLLLVLTLLFSCGYCLAGQTEKALAEKMAQMARIQAEPEYARWVKSVNAHLLQHDSAVIQLEAIDQHVMSKKQLFSSQREPTSLQFIEKLNSILENHQNLDKASLNKLILTCKNVEFESHCRNYPLHERQLEIDADNALVYLPLLDKADVQGVLQRMLQATTANQYYGVNLHQIKQEITAFEKTNPLPNNAPNDLNLLLKINPASSYLQPYLSKKFAAHEKEITINTLVLAYQFGSNQIPNYRLLFEVCSLQANQQACRQIAKILINKGDVNEVQQVGYAIAQNAASHSSDSTWNSAIFDKARFKTSLRCFSTIRESPLVVIFEPIYFNTLMKNRTHSNESTAIREAGFVLHQQLLKQGMDIAYEPDFCEAIRSMTDAGYINHVGNDHASLKGLIR